MPAFMNYATKSGVEDGMLMALITMAIAEQHKAIFKNPIIGKGRG